MKQKSDLWTIYDHPAEHPHDFVARLTILGSAPELTGKIVIARSLEQLRAHFRKRGLTPVPRTKADDPKIVESWK